MTSLRVTLLGFVLPDDDFQALLADDEGMPTQTQLFGRSLARALRDGGSSVSLLSSAPATSYPYNRSLRFVTSSIEIEGAHGKKIGFINAPALKHISRLVGVMRHGPRELHEFRSDVLVIHGIHSPWLAFGVYASRRLHIPAVAVLTDPPNVPHEFDTLVTRALKRLDKRLVILLLARLNGIVALTQPLAADYAPGLPFLVMEGIAPESRPDLPRLAPTSHLPTVLYAGRLSEEYGVRILLEAHDLEPSAFRLQIAGRGPLEQLVRGRADSQANLEYLGLVSPTELPNLLASADVLVNPRPPGQGFTAYSFPSKILEYLAAGRPVVSTRLEGIPRDYDPVLEYATASATGLLEAIKRLWSLSPEDRESIGRRNRRFAAGRRSSRAQGRRLVQFLSALAAKPSSSRLACDRPATN